MTAEGQPENNQLSPLPAGLEELSPSDAIAVRRMTPDQQTIFKREYLKKKRSLGAMMALAAIFPIHFWFLKEPRLGVGYWLWMGAACGLTMSPLITDWSDYLVMGSWLVIAWMVGLSDVPDMVRNYNEDRAEEIACSISEASPQS